MKTKLPKILSLLLTVVLLASLMIGAAVVPAAAGGEAWTTMSYPRAGALGKYIMGPAAGVTLGTGPMEMAVDGTLYAYWDIAEADNLYKSTDGARTWSRCSTGTDGLGAVAIAAIACSPEDANILYVTDGIDVWRSSNAGATFVTLVRPANGVNCMAVGYNGGNHYIYIATTAVGVGNDVEMMQDSFGAGWGTTCFDTLFLGQNPAQRRTIDALACSPNFATEGTPQVIAVSHVTAPGGAWVADMCFASSSKGGAAWADYTEIQESTAAGTSFVAAVTAADIAFPADYTSAAGANDFFVGITAGAVDSDVYRIIGGTDLDTNIQAAGVGTPVTSVAAAGNSGSCKLLAAGDNIAGALGANVYRSTNNGTTWTPSSKDIACTTTGTPKYLVMADDYLDSGKAWVATVRVAANDQSSVAQTTDAGVSWDDLSMINTDIDQIHNLAVSPDYANDSTYFMLTSPTAGQDSVWKYDGSQWNRVFTNAVIAAATSMVQFSPGFASDTAVFLADTATPAIYRSTNGGGWFKGQLTAPAAFTGSWIVLDSSTLIVGDAARASISKNNGTTWSPKGLAGATAPVLSFAKSPDYVNDSTLLLGDSAGGVYRSTDGGGKWSGIPAGVVTAGGGALSVAFDAGYASNSTVYAVDATSDDVYRLVIGTDTAWKRIDAGNATTWPGASTAGGVLNASRFVPGVQAAPDGALYVTDRAAAAGAAVAGDTFTIVEPVAAGSNGTIVVSAGSVTATPNATATVAAAGVAVVITPATGAVAWTTAAAGDSVSVVSGMAGTIGTWTLAAGAASASVTTDADGDASVAAAAGVFSLPDAVGAGAAGANHVLLRSINPTASRASTRGVYFEPMTYGFAGTAANLVGVWYSSGSNTLWTLESAAGAAADRIWVYTDDLTVAPELKKPADKANTGRTTTASLSWTGLPNCPRYEVWVSTNDGFSTFTGASPLFSGTSSVSVGGLSAGRTYYWKVCAAASNAATAGRALSPWSATRSFTTGIAAAEWSPFTNSDGVAPSAGAADVPIRPSFQWNSADWATGYEFELSKDSRTTARGYFVEVVTSATGDNALVNCVWLCDRDLDYSTTYYWHVKAISATSKSVWGTGVFTTEAAPVVPEPPPPPPVTPEPTTPGYIWAVIGIGAALCLAVIVLIVRTRRVV